MATVKFITPVLERFTRPVSKRSPSLKRPHEMTAVGEALRQHGGVVVVQANAVLDRIVSVEPMRCAVRLSVRRLQIRDVNPPQFNIVAGGPGKAAQTVQPQPTSWPSSMTLSPGTPTVPFSEAVLFQSNRKRRSGRRW